jgi:hypothetical protein
LHGEFVSGAALRLFCRPLTASASCGHNRRDHCVTVTAPGLLGPDASGLDDRPPFLYLRILQGGEHFWCLLLGRHDLLPKLGGLLAEPPNAR